MGVPETKVFIAFDLSALGGPYFTLDDSIKGLLDNSLYPLAGELFEDVTSKVKSVSISRGKSRELDRFSAGEASVIFDNRDRTFDPFYDDSPYVNQIVPKKKIKITSGDQDTFIGTIDDWNLTYDVSGQSEASVNCADGFVFLASAFLTAHTATSELSGARVNAVLDRPEVNWPVSDRDIDTGQSLLQADAVDENTNVLTYLQKVESSEVGSLFMTKSNLVAFKDSVNIPDTIGVLQFTDDGTGIGYQNIDVVYGTEQLFNRVIATNLNGTPQIAENVNSQSLYGISALVADDLLLTTDAEALNLANYLLGIYDQPELRVDSLSVELANLSNAIQQSILQLDLNDIIEIKFTPNNVGSSIDRYAQIVGISHDIRIDSHSIQLFLRSVQDLPLILDDPVYGRLGGSLPLYDDSVTLYDSPEVLYDGQEDYGYVLGF
jgi:hypothetical protein